MLRNVLGVIVGLSAGVVVNWLLIKVNTGIYPPPEGTDMMDPEQANAYIATLPATAFILVILAHLGQAFVGGWVAAKVGKSRPVLLAMIIGVLTLIGGIMNAIMLTEAPKWMMIELPFYLIVAWYAGKMVEKSRAGSSD